MALSPLQQVQVIEQRMAIERSDAATRLDDTDGDAIPDVIMSTKDGVEVYRAADLLAGRETRHALEYPPGGRYGSVDQVTDLTGDGRPEIVASLRLRGGSADHRSWGIFQWDGKAYQRLFAAGVDNWRGENWLTVEPGRITLTCRPLGPFDHKHMPHRQQREVWVWRNGAFRHDATYRPPAPSARQQVSDAERLLLRQDYEGALPLYRHALTLPKEEYDRPDWAPFIHLRVGQIYALLGRPAQAREAWKEAAGAGGYVGEAARVLAAKPFVPALAHLHTWQREPDREGPLSLTGPALAPMQVVLQAYLTSGGQPDKTDLKAVGLDVQDLIHKDLDGDGQEEVWVRIHGTGYLAVKTRQGWRVGPTQSEDLPEWDGKLVHYRTPMAKWSAPLLPEPIERCITPP